MYLLVPPGAPASIPRRTCQHHLCACLCPNVRLLAPLGSPASVPWHTSQVNHMHLPETLVNLLVPPAAPARTFCAHRQCPIAKPTSATMCTCQDVASSSGVHLIVPLVHFPVPLPSCRAPPPSPQGALRSALQRSKNILNIHVYVISFACWWSP